MSISVPQSVVERLSAFSPEDLIVFAYWHAWRACMEFDDAEQVAELLASDVEEFLLWRSHQCSN